MIAGCQHVLELIANVNVVVANAALEDRSGGGSRWWRSRSQIFGRHGVATLVIQPTPLVPIPSCLGSLMSQRSRLLAFKMWCCVVFLVSFRRATPQTVVVSVLH